MPHDGFRLGAYEVTPLCDGWAPLPLSEELPRVDVDWRAERERFPWAFPDDDDTSWAWHVHAFLIRGLERTVLVDTGIGHLGRPPYDVEGRLDDELASRGVAPEDVDDVIVTHLHADHSGGVCRPEGTPRFPNARHHVHPEDWEFFAEHRAPEDFTARSVMTAIEAAGLLSLDPSDHTEISDPSISVRHAPGHTPGHRVVLLEDRGDTLLLTGDLLHTTPQITHPTKRSNHDEDPTLAAGERWTLVTQASRSGWAVGVSHFGLPFGRVGGTVDEPTWEPL